MARIVCISSNESIVSLLIIVWWYVDQVVYHFEEEGQLNFGSSRLK